MTALRGFVSNRPSVLLVALLCAVALALVAWHAAGPQTSASDGPKTTFHLSVGAEQVDHNRSEQGLGATSPTGEQVAHNRSEEGLGNS